MSTFRSIGSARWPIVLLAATILSASGCGRAGDKKMTVRGTVSCQGQRLNTGLLAFHGPGDAYAAAPIQPDGTFTAELAPGDVKVSILETPRGSKAAPAVNPPIAVPEKYGNPESSGLRFTITPSTSKLPIELE